MKLRQRKVSQIICDIIKRKTNLTPVNASYISVVCAKHLSINIDEIIILSEVQDGKEK